MFIYLFTGFYSVMKVIRLYSLSSKLGGPLSLGALGGRPLRLCLTPLLNATNENEDGRVGKEMSTIYRNFKVFCASVFAISFRKTVEGSKRETWPLFVRFKAFHGSC